MILVIMTTHKLKVGQLVEIRAHIDDEDICNSRIGLLLGEDAEDGLWHVSINGKTLVFNEGWLAPVERLKEG